MARTRITARERKQLVAYVVSLRKDFVQQLLEALDLPKSGIKADLRARLDAALVGNQKGIDATIRFLDSREPWGKQQVELLTIPAAIATKWASQSAVLAQLKVANRESLLQEPELLAMPGALKITSITVAAGTVEIRAVESRDYFERDPSRDYESQADGLDVRYRAQVRRISRGVFLLRMRPSLRTASLHISQGDRTYDYADARARFNEALREVVDVDLFDRVDLRKAVPKFHANEVTARAAGKLPVTREHRVAVRLTAGHTMSLTSAAADQQMAGDPAIEQTLAAANSGGATSAMGNLYFLSTAAKTNPVDEEVHVVLTAGDGSVHIRTPTNEEVVVYVIDTIRGLC